MGAKSSIGWTDATWNPTRGCSMAKGSETGGCLNCYAARMAARGLPNLNSPITGEPFAVIRDSGPRWTGKVELIESMLELPMRWKPSRIFVNSMSARPWDGYVAIPRRGGDSKKYIKFRDRAGADPSEWPEDLRVQGFPK